MKQYQSKQGFSKQRQAWVVPLILALASPVQATPPPPPVDSVNSQSTHHTYHRQDTQGRELHCEYDETDRGREGSCTYTAPGIEITRAFELAYSLDTPGNSDSTGRVGSMNPQRENSQGSPELTGRFGTLDPSISSGNHSNHDPFTRSVPGLDWTQDHSQPQLSDAAPPATSRVSTSSQSGPQRVNAEFAQAILQGPNPTIMALNERQYQEQLYQANLHRSEQDRRLREMTQAMEDYNRNFAEFARSNSDTIRQMQEHFNASAELAVRTSRMDMAAIAELRERLKDVPLPNFPTGPHYVGSSPEELRGFIVSVRQARIDRDWLRLAREVSGVLQEIAVLHRSRSSERPALDYLEQQIRIEAVDNRGILRDIPNVEVPRHWMSSSEKALHGRMIRNSLNEVIASSAVLQETCSINTPANENSCAQINDLSSDLMAGYFLLDSIADFSHQREAFLDGYRALESGKDFLVGLARGVLTGTVNTVTAIPQAVLHLPQIATGIYHAITNYSVTWDKIKEHAVNQFDLIVNADPETLGVITGEVIGTLVTGPLATARILRVGGALRQAVGMAETRAAVEMATGVAAIEGRIGAETQAAMKEIAKKSPDIAKDTLNSAMQEGFSEAAQAEIRAVSEALNPPRVGRVSGGVSDSVAPRAARAVELTPAQQARVNRIENLIRDHATEGDFNGVIRELRGERIPNGSGDYFNHIREMQDSVAGLRNHTHGLEGSLRNPNLSPEIRQHLENVLNRANQTIERMERALQGSL